MADEAFVFPASTGQHRLWFLDRLLQSGAAYNVCQAFRIEGPLDRRWLAAAVQAVVARHESLRTSFRQLEDELRQVVVPELTVPLAKRDLSSFDAAAVAAALDAEGARTFDLTTAPLVRATLFDLGAGASVFMIVAHHIVVDGWSMTVMLREIADCCAAFAQGRTPGLPPLAVQYADYTLWEQQQLHGPDHPDASFWRTRLHGLDTPLDLPADVVRPSTRSFRGHLTTFRIDRDLTARLRALTRGDGGSLFIAALAALGAVLHRYTGASSIPLGGPVANRVLAELEQVVGFFANTVVFRADCHGDPTFRELLSRVRRDALEVYSYQSTPFDRIVRVAGGRSVSDRNPLFQVAVAHQQQPDILFALPGLAVAPLVVANGTAKFDILLELQERTEDVEALLEMSADLFSADAAGRLRDHFLHALTLMVEEPERRLSELPLMSAAERALIDATNATDVEYPRDRTIAGLFEEQARAAPTSPAVVCGDEALTYGELNARADALAARLVAHGVGPEITVGVALERSLDLIVSLVAILKAGGAYVPVDLAYPAERIAFMLADSKAVVVLTTARDAAAMPHGLPVLLVDAEPDASATTPAITASAPESGDRLAYVMYTSGTTGRPKGVPIVQRGVVRLVRGSTFVDWADIDAMLYVSSVAFDVSTFEIWGALLNGKQLVIMPERDFDLGRLAAVLTRHRVDCVWLTASLFNALVDYRPDALAAVRQLVVGGEALSPSHVRRAYAHLPTTRIINGYGPTECTTFACCHPVPRDVADEPTSIPIGVPIANTRAHVLDASRAELPVGMAGELCLGGDGLARGYLNDHRLTAERFVRDPRSRDADDRVYRTGDRVRRLADGIIDFLGRIDGQVKLRGFRIELGEIESVLNQHPSVAEAAVVLREDGPGGPRLVAYMTRRPAPQHSADDLRGHLRRSLPEYMVPAAFVDVDELPRTAHGKLDRAALPIPAMPERPAADAARPSTPTELAIARLWTEVLGEPAVDRNAGFFDAGGHSLAALRLFAGIERTFGVALPLGALLHSSTIAELARMVDAAGREVPPAPASPLVAIKAGRTPPLVCVHSLSGDVLEYRDLASHLPADRTVLGLQAVLDEAIDTRYASLEATAAAYIEALRRAQPHGPYHLCGWSSGATVALEMAQQVLAAGEEVAFLGAIDAAPFNVVMPKPAPAMRRLARQIANVPLWVRDDLLTTSPSQIPFRARQALRGVSRWFGPPTRPEAVREMVNFPERSGPWERFAQLHYQAFRQYVPRPYPGRVTVFTASTQPLLWWNDVERAWQQIARLVEVRQAAGTHFSIVKQPHVRVLAEAIDAAMRR